MPYLQRGVWPLLVSLVAGMVVAVPAGVIMMVAVMFIPLARGNPVAVVLAAGVVMVMAVVAVAGSMFLMTPFMVRAALLQDFGQSFNVTWVKDFLARTWRELLLETVFLWVTSLPMMIIGYAMCFVGLYAATALLSIAHWHLNLQIYRLFVARGGAPLVPKGFPPPIP
jgi:hypothetical protein